MKLTDKDFLQVLKRDLGPEIAATARPIELRPQKSSPRSAPPRLPTSNVSFRGSKKSRRKSSTNSTNFQKRSNTRGRKPTPRMWRASLCKETSDNASTR